MNGFDINQIDIIKEELDRKGGNILNDPNLSEKEREKEYLEFISKIQKELSEYKMQYDKSGLPHTVYELNDMVQKIESSDLEVEEKVIALKKLEETFGDIFTREGRQCKKQIYIPEFVKSDSPPGEIYVDFPINEGLIHAKGLEREFFGDRVYLTRYAACIDDKGYNYSQKIDGEFPDFEELCLPYFMDDAKNKNQILFGEKYTNLVESVSNNYLGIKDIERECNKLNNKYSEYNLDVERYQKIQTEYNELQEKLKNIKDDGGQFLKDTTFGVIGVAAPLLKNGKIILPGGAINIDLVLKNDTLEELGIIKSDAPVTRKQYYYAKEYYESDGSLESQIKLMKKFTSK